jgi:sRNA-binding carbon storage regulator CsrA
VGRNDKNKELHLLSGINQVLQINNLFDLGSIDVNLNRNKIGIKMVRLINVFRKDLYRGL